MPARARRSDPRRTATRRALLDAFAVAVLSIPYEDLRVEDLARRAGVSRSTFYAHFTSKNALLSASLQGVFELLVDAVLPEDRTRQITTVLEHFWQHRARARGLFGPAMRDHSVAVLARLVEKRLGRGALLLPRRLAARQIADSLLSPVIAWLLGEVHCPAARLAQALRRTARGLVSSLRA